MLASVYALAFCISLALRGIGLYSRPRRFFFGGWVDWRALSLFFSCREYFFICIFFLQVNCSYECDIGTLLDSTDKFGTEWLGTTTNFIDVYIHTSLISGFVLCADT